MQRDKNAKNRCFDSMVAGWGWFSGSFLHLESSYELNSINLTPSSVMEHVFRWFVNISWFSWTIGYIRVTKNVVMLTWFCNMLTFYACAYRPARKNAGAIVVCDAVDSICRERTRLYEGIRSKCSYLVWSELQENLICCTKMTQW